MAYSNLPPGSRIENGKLIIPLTDEQIQSGLSMSLRTKATPVVPPSIPLTLTLAPPTDEGSGVSLTKILAAEPLTYLMPVAVINDRAYRYDPTNAGHAYAFSGFSVADTPLNGTSQLKSIGTVTTPPGITLTPNQRYLAGSQPNTPLVTAPGAGDAFTRIIAFALSATKLRIVNAVPIFRAV